MKDNDFLPIQGWMYKMQLTDKQRAIYAHIWSYSRDGRNVCRSTAKELAEWADCQERNAKYIIRQLEDRGLIRHKVIRTVKKTWTEFWAVLPENAITPDRGSKEKIEWAGRAKVCPTERAAECPTERATDCPTNTVSIYSRNKRNKTGGGKNNARSRAKKTTTTGFLFENDESGLAPGNPTILALPFAEPYFVDAWQKLVRQPKWSGKSPEALQLTLDAFAETGDPVLSAFCCIKAIENDWPKITDPSKIGLDDQEQLESFADKCTGIARKEGGEA